MMKIEAVDHRGRDTTMFSAHPDGYVCRCGLPAHCVCPTDYPDEVIADLSARIAELEEALSAYEEPTR
jgi:hypothetical protein